MSDVRFSTDIRQDIITYLEIARVALRDAEFGEVQRREIDLSDREVDRLAFNLETFMNTEV